MGFHSRRFLSYFHGLDFLGEDDRVMAVMFILSFELWLGGLKEMSTPTLACPMHGIQEQCPDAAGGNPTCTFPVHLGWRCPEHGNIPEEEVGTAIVGGGTRKSWFHKGCGHELISRGEVACGLRMTSVI